MKKALKHSLILAIILLVILCLFAKYDTYGAVPGSLSKENGEHFVGFKHYIGERSNNSVDEVASIRAGYYLYTNRFGRTVIAESTQGWKRNSIPLYQKLHGQYDEVIVNVKTVPAAIPTHLDFLSLSIGGSTVEEVVAKCGMPNGGWPGDLWDLKYITPDGYYYTISFDMQNPITTVSAIHAQYVGENGKLQAFNLWTVRLIYLAIAAVLSIILVLLIKIPNNIRKRKALPQTD